MKLKINISIITQKIGVWMFKHVVNQNKMTKETLHS